MQVQWQRWALGCEGDLSAAPQRCFPGQMVWDIRRLRPERFYQCERATSLHPLQYKYLEKTISLIGEKWDPLVNFLPLLLTIGDCIFPSNWWATCLFCLESPLRLCYYRGSRRGLVKTAHSIHEDVLPAAWTFSTCSLPFISFTPWLVCCFVLHTDILNV